MKYTFFPSAVSPIIVIVCVYLQEWQNSIQKNAGLAFIELVNEGRWVMPLISFISSLFTISPFPVSPVFHHFIDPSLNLFGSGDRVALYDSGLGGKKNQWLLGGGWSGAWESEGGLSLSSSLRSISACPSGIWKEERGWAEGERASDHWFLCDTWEMALDFLLSFCQCLSFHFIYL